MRGKISEWAVDTAQAVRDAVDQLQKRPDMEEPIVTYSDDWKYKSEAERRRWAIESAAVRVVGTDVTLDELLTLSQKIVEFIDSGLRPVQPPSVSLPVPRESEDLSSPLPDAAA